MTNPATRTAHREEAIERLSSGLFGGSRRRYSRRWIFLGIALTIALASPTNGWCQTGSSAAATGIDPALEKASPETLDDLRAIEAALARIVERAMACTVGISGPGTRGSGVIVSPDGIVATAAHVTGGTPGQRITVVLSDGRSVSGVTLGVRLDSDLGLARIDGTGPWPHAELGDSLDLARGSWCLATGHPGGYERGRSPIVRVGRVLATNRRSVRSDCSIASGDSGGPLFDVHGRVVGIHSRIGLELDGNYHIPIHLFRDDWERLEQSDRWGGEDRMVIGVRGSRTETGCVIQEVVPDLPAARAGLRADDVILSIDGNALTSWEQLTRGIAQRKPGDHVTLEFQRGAERRSVRVYVVRMR